MHDSTNIHTGHSHLLFSQTNNPKLNFQESDDANGCAKTSLPAGDAEIRCLKVKIIAKAELKLKLKS